MSRLAQLIRLTPLALALLPLNSWADAASDIAELKARLAQLEQQVQEAAAKPAPVAAPASSGGLQVSDTKFGFKGYVKLDAISSQFSEGEVGRTVGRDFYVPNQIPVFGAAGTGATAGANGKARNFFDLHAKQTRFIVTTETPTGGENALKGHIEMDFLSSAQGDERISNGYSPELRQAFVTYGKWLAGQAWTTFQDLGALPETADFVGSSDGAVFGRQPQVRYTNGPWQLAVENSQTVVGGSNANGGATAAPVESNDSVVPDVVARYTHKGSFGYVSTAGLVRQLKAKNPVAGGVNIGDSKTGYGITVSGKIKVGSKDDIRFMVTHGDGIGRYMSLNTSNDATINTATGELDLIGITAGYVTYHHKWTDKLRSNLQFSVFSADNPDSATADATKSVSSGLINLMYAVNPKLDIGVEGLHATRKVEGGAEGDMDRLHFMARYNF
ncbi:MAG: DcaP family trimeric outer membrane transporter [Pseudomonadota bacterium]